MRSRRPYYVCHPWHATEVDAGLYQCYETGLSLISARALAGTLAAEGKEVQIRKRTSQIGLSYKVIPLVQRTKPRSTAS